MEKIFFQEILINFVMVCNREVEKEFPFPFEKNSKLFPKVFLHVKIFDRT
jgi:hypothetical protein